MTVAASAPEEPAATVAPRSRSPLLSATRRAHARRISYFMLFRLAILAAATVLAGILFYADDGSFGRTRSAVALGVLVGGYVMTIACARALPRVQDLARFAALQTAFDILMTAVAVHASGGVDSGFATLYLIAVLGAATMGSPRQTWVAAGAAASVYITMSLLEQLQVVIPLTSGYFTPLPGAEHWSTVARTLAGIAGVTVLSSYLNTQLATTALQVGALRALNENIVRSLNAGLITTDLDGRLLYFNPAARTILELRDEDVGQPAEGLLRGLANSDEAGGANARQDLDFTTPSGRKIHVGLTRAPLLDADGICVGYVINFQDVSRLHELAQSVRRNERLAAVGGLAASVAHEIRNPLAAISGSAELLSQMNLSGDDERLLKIIRRESGRLSELIADLLAFTRPRPPVRELVDLSTVVLEACEAFQTDRANAGVIVDCTYQDVIEVRVDSAQLAQVLWNLMRNATESMDGAGRIVVELEANASDAQIRIIDEGRGIDPEDIGAVFDPFFTTKDHGTGFGLAIVHRVVEDNGGTVSVASEAGKGSTFTLTFPRYQAEIAASDSGVLELGRR